MTHSPAIQRKIWCLWEPAGTLPPYLRICLETIERNAGVPVELVGPDDLLHLAPRLDQELAARISKPGQRSDYYRAHLLYAQGGMWLDVDSVVVADVNWMFEGADSFGLGLRDRGLGVGTTHVIAPPSSPTMARWIVHQERILKETAPGAALPWTSLGAPSLSEACKSENYFVLARERVAPVPWQKADIFTSRFLAPQQVVRQDVTIVNLYNEKFPPWLKSAAREELLRSDILLARIFRIALGLSDEAAETRPYDRFRPIESAYRRLTSGIRNRSKWR